MAGPPLSSFLDVDPPLVALPQPISRVEALRYVQYFSRFKSIVGSSATPSQSLMAVCDYYLCILKQPKPTVLVTDDSYRRACMEHRQEANLPFCGGPSQSWAKWRALAREAPHLWDDILRRKYQDRQVVPISQCVYKQAPRPSASQLAHQRPVEEDLITKGVVVEEMDPSRNGSILPVHMIDKGPMPDGSPQLFRMVVDGSGLKFNELVPKCRGQTVEDIVMNLQHNSFQCMTDAKAFFFQFAAREMQQRVQRIWSSVFKGLARFCSMSMGIEGAPRVATTSMAVLAMIVRREFSATLPMMPHLIALDTYVDELKTQDESMVGCYLNTVLVRMMMTWLGILINWEKSTMGPPGRKVVAVGIVMHSTNLLVQAAPKRLESIVELAQSMISAPTISAHDLCRLQGMVGTLLRLHQAAGRQSVQLAAVLKRCIRLGGNRKPQLRRTKLTTLDRRQIQPELEFWALRHPELEIMPASTWKQGEVLARFNTDASMYGFAIAIWSVHFPNPQKPVLVHGYFNAQERQLDHNIHEFISTEQAELAILRHPVLSMLLSPSKVQRVVGTSDNTTVVAAYNKNRSRSPAIHARITAGISRRVQAGLFVQMHHITKEVMDNQTSEDRRGRFRSKLWDRLLPPHLVQCILRAFNLEARPLLDLFASRAARQSDRYVSLQLDPAALWVNAFSQMWNTSTNRFMAESDLLWAFPPENQIQAVLHHVIASRSPLVLMVVPVWSRPWMQTLLTLLVCQPVYFPGGTSLLVPPEGDYIANEIKMGSWSWAACLIDGRRSVQSKACKAFRLKSPEKLSQKGILKDISAIIRIRCGADTSLSNKAKEFIRLMSPRKR